MKVLKSCIFIIALSVCIVLLSFTAIDLQRDQSDLFPVAIQASAKAATQKNENISIQRSSEQPIYYTCTEHIPSDWIIDSDATCLFNGTKHTECVLCGKVIKEGNIPAKGHSYTNYTYNNDATCTINGTKTALCDNGCGKLHTISDPDHLAQGHLESDWIIDKHPTCITNGVKHTECLHCAEIIKDNYYIVAQGHNYTVVIENYREPDCTTDGGYDEITICTSCNTVASCNKVFLQSSHILYDFVMILEPTCDSEGSEYSICKVCNQNVILESIPAIGHIGGTATCTALAVCTRCEKEYGKLEEHHLYNENIIQHPTCDSSGTKIGICYVCDEKITITIPPYENHTFMSYEILSGATCTEPEIRIRFCRYCDASKTYSIYSALGHSFKEYVSKKSDTGEYTHSQTCTRCNFTITESCDFTAKDGSLSKNCETCGVYNVTIPSYRTCGHICHSYNKFDRLWWKISRFFFKLFGANEYCPCGTKHY